MKLNLGSGNRPLEGYLGVDLAPNADIKCYLRKLEFAEDNTVEEIIAIHVIEHFYKWEVQSLQQEWRRVRKPGGKIILECPDLKKAAHAFLMGAGDQMGMWAFYGNPDLKNEFHCHHWGYVTIRTGILSRIEREIEGHRQYGDGCIIYVKLNALVDRDCITALYGASQAGVQVILQVRGICCLRPGKEGVSDHVRVSSIVGRFLEHTRLYYFRNGGEDEILLGSADLMPRNLDRRVEVLFPVVDPTLKEGLLTVILPTHLRDNTKSRILRQDGTYDRAPREPGIPVENAQEWCISHRGTWQHGDRPS